MPAPSKSEPIGHDIVYRFEITSSTGDKSNSWEQGNVRAALARWPGWYSVLFDDGQPLDVLLTHINYGDVWRWAPTKSSSAPAVPPARVGKKSTLAATTTEMGALLVRKRSATGSKPVRWTKYADLAAARACLTQLRGHTVAVARTKVAQSCASGGSTVFAEHHFQRADDATDIQLSTTLPATAAAAKHRLCESCYAVHRGSFGSGRFCGQACSNVYSAACKAARKKPNAGSRASNSKSKKKLAAFVCENCSTRHDGSFGVGRFCTKSCAASNRKRPSFICEGCGELHDGSYGSGRFCHKTCAARPSRQSKRSRNDKSQVDDKQVNDKATFRCEACSKMHNGTYGSGQFCDKFCQRSRAAGAPRRAAPTMSMSTRRTKMKTRCKQDDCSFVTVHDENYPETVVKGDSVGDGRDHSTQGHICETCLKKHDASGGFVRFCSASCKGKYTVAVRANRRTLAQFDPVQMLLLFYTTVGDRKSSSEITSIIDNVRGTSDAWFVGLCGQLNRKYQQHPITVWESAQTAGRPVQKNQTDSTCEQQENYDDCGDGGDDNDEGQEQAQEAKEEERKGQEEEEEEEEEAVMAAVAAAGEEEEEDVGEAEEQGREQGREQQQQQQQQQQKQKQEQEKAVCPSVTNSDRSVLTTDPDGGRTEPVAVGSASPKLEHTVDNSPVQGNGHRISRPTQWQGQGQDQLNQAKGRPHVKTEEMQEPTPRGPRQDQHHATKGSSQMTTERTRGLTQQQGQGQNHPADSIQRPARSRRKPKKFEEQVPESRELRAHRTMPKVSPERRLRDSKRADSTQVAPAANKRSMNVQNDDMLASEKPVDAAAAPGATAKKKFKGLRVYSRQAGTRQKWMEHKSISAAVRDRGLSRHDRSNISRCCTGEIPVWKGFEFKPADSTQVALAAKRSMDMKTNRALASEKPVDAAAADAATADAAAASATRRARVRVYSRQAGTRQKWMEHKSILAAARDRGLSSHDRGNISRCCTGEIPVWKGFEFKPADSTQVALAAKRSMDTKTDRALASEKPVDAAAADAATAKKKFKGVLEAPVFHPTEEEFLDPMGYIESIRPEAEKFGICNIVPPSSWKSELRLDPELKFQASKQKLHMAPLPGQPIGFRKSKRLFTKDSFASRSAALARELYGERTVELGEKVGQDPSILEAEFWHLAEQHSTGEQMWYHSKKAGGQERPQKIPESLYGSDVISTGHENGTDWNLCRLAGLSDNILHYVSYPIHGVNTPMLYFGMLFSRFCWHVEDDDLNSISYLHEGAPKTWWGVPASAADRFESLFKQHYAEHLESYPSLQYAKGVMLSPEKLLQADVPVSHLVHRPGTFVVTFPHAYHCGFNHGVNVAEAVNFAGFDWLKHGLSSMNLYRKIPVVKSSVLGFEKLLCDLARHARVLSARLADETLSHLETIANEYDSFLADVETKRVMPIELSVTPPDSNSLGVMCSVCNHHCYIMGIHCKQAVPMRSKRQPEEHWSCTRHFELLRQQGLTELTCCMFAPLGMVRGLMGQVCQTQQLRSRSCKDQSSSTPLPPSASASKALDQPCHNLSTAVVGSRVAVADDPTITGRIDSINHGYAQLTLDTGSRRAFRVGNLMRIDGGEAVANQRLTPTTVRFIQCCAPGCERWHELPTGHPMPPANSFVCAQNSWNPEKGGCSGIDPGSDKCAPEKLDAREAVYARPSVPKPACSDRSSTCKRPRSISNDTAPKVTGTSQLAKSIVGGIKKPRVDEGSTDDTSAVAGHITVATQQIRVDSSNAETSKDSAPSTHMPHRPTEEKGRGRNLTQPQYRLAAKLLNTHFDQELGTNQFRHKKQELVDLVNNEFKKQGMAEKYTAHKLDLWVANAVQRVRQEAKTEMHKRDERFVKSTTGRHKGNERSASQYAGKLDTTAAVSAKGHSTKYAPAKGHSNLSVHKSVPMQATRMPLQNDWSQVPQETLPHVVWMSGHTKSAGPHLLHLPVQHQTPATSTAAVRTVDADVLATAVDLTQQRSSHITHPHPHPQQHPQHSQQQHPHPQHPQQQHLQQQHPQQQQQQPRHDKQTLKAAACISATRVAGPVGQVIGPGAQALNPLAPPTGTGPPATAPAHLCVLGADGLQVQMATRVTEQRRELERRELERQQMMLRLEQQLCSNRQQQQQQQQLQMMLRLEQQLCSNRQQQQLHMQVQMQMQRMQQARATGINNRT